MFNETVVQMVEIIDKKKFVPLLSREEYLDWKYAYRIKVENID